MWALCAKGALTVHFIMSTKLSDMYLCMCFLTPVLQKTLFKKLMMHYQNGICHNGINSENRANITAGISLLGVTCCHVLAIIPDISRLTGQSKGLVAHFNQSEKSTSEMNCIGA